MMQVGKPVTGEEFIGREAEIEMMIEYISMGQNMVLIAPRRFGKTSLVQEVLNRVKQKKNYKAFVDVFNHATLDSLSESITAEVLHNHGLRDTFRKVKDSAVDMFKHVKLKSVIEDFEFVLSFSDKTVPPLDRFSMSLDFINDFSAKHKKKMAFAFDEFGDIVKYDKTKELTKMVRAKLQQQESAVYIFSGSYESVMQSMFVDSKSPFYRMARIIDLGYLDFNALEKHFITQFKKNKLTNKNNLIEDTLDLFKGHPYYAQLALQQIYLFQRLNKEVPNLEELIEEMLASDHGYLERLWEDLSSSKENVYVLKHLTLQADGVYSMAKDHQINASRTLKHLNGLGIIYKEDGGYYFYDPLFEIWIARNISS